MKLYYKKTLTRMALVNTLKELEEAAKEFGFEDCERLGWSKDKVVLITAQPYPVIVTASGSVMTRFPFWLAVDTDGYPYPIHPQVHAKSYAEAPDVPRKDYSIGVA